MDEPLDLLCNQNLSKEIECGTSVAFDADKIFQMVTYGVKLKSNYDSLIVVAYVLSTLSKSSLSYLSEHLAESNCCKMELSRLVSSENKVMKEIEATYNISPLIWNKFINLIKPRPYVLLLNKDHSSIGNGKLPVFLSPYSPTDAGILFKDGRISILSSPYSEPLLVVTPEPCIPKSNNNAFMEENPKGTKDTGYIIYLREIEVFTAGDPWWDPKPEIYIRIDYNHTSYQQRTDLPEVDYNNHLYTYGSPGLYLGINPCYGHRWDAISVWDDDSWWKEWNNDDLIGVRVDLPDYPPTYVTYYLKKNGQNGAVLKLYNKNVNIPN